MAAVQGAPAPPRARSAHSFETGTLPHELLAGFVAAVGYLDSIGCDAIVAHERELGERFLAGLPASCTLYGLPTMEGRVPTFCFNVEASRRSTRPRGSASATWRSGAGTTTRSR